MLFDKGNSFHERESKLEFWHYAIEFEKIHFALFKIHLNV